MITRWAALAGLLAATPLSAQSGGRAEVDLIRESGGYGPGEALWVGVRMKIEDGWHTYWENPGAGGMRPEINWSLPEGWTAGPLQFPDPITFTTGDLPGFGYEDEVVFPVRLEVPEDFSGAAELIGQFDWLACDDRACVAGNASVRANWPADGEGAAVSDELERWKKRVPQPREGAALAVDAGDAEIGLELILPESIDLTKARVFPATAGVIDDGAGLSFKAHGDGVWTAEVPRHDFAPEVIARLDLVVVAPGIEPPLRVGWERPE